MTIENFIALFRDPFVEDDKEEVYFPKILFKGKTGYGYRTRFEQDADLLFIFMKYMLWFRIFVSEYQYYQYSENNENLFDAEKQSLYHAAAN
jgi:hypothetical protein